MIASAAQGRRRAWDGDEGGSGCREDPMPRVEGRGRGQAGAGAGLERLATARLPDGGVRLPTGAAAPWQRGQAESGLA